MSPLHPITGRRRRARLVRARQVLRSILSPLSMRIASLTVTSGCILAVAAGIPLLTLSFDEAWILGGAANLATEGYFGIGSTLGSNSTGGLYVIAQWIVASLVGNNLIAARALILLSMLLLLREVSLVFRAASDLPAASTAGRLLVLGVPGVLFFSALADGAVPSTWLMLWGLRRWRALETHRASRPNPLLAGTLLGTAVATRINLALILPALVLSVWTRRSGPPHLLRSALLVCSIAISIVALDLAALAALTRTDVTQSVNSSAYAWGLDGLLSSLHPNPLTEKVIVWHELFPVGLLAVSAIVILPRTSRMPESQSQSASSVLLWFSLLLLGAWMLSPRALYRYLLPSAICTVVGLGLIAVHAIQHLSPTARRAASLCLVVFALGQATAEFARMTRIVLHGSSDDAILWFQNERPVSGLYAFKAWRGERQLVEFVNAMPVSSRMACLGPDALDLVYLTGRDIRSLRITSRAFDGDGPMYLILRPALGRDLTPPFEALQWLKANCTAVARFHRCTVFRVADGATPPEDPDILNWRTWTDSSN